MQFPPPLSGHVSGICGLSLPGDMSHGPNHCRTPEIPQREIEARLISHCLQHIHLLQIPRSKIISQARRPPRRPPFRRHLRSAHVLHDDRLHDLQLHNNQPHHHHANQAPHRHSLRRSSVVLPPCAYPRRKCYVLVFLCL